MNDVSVSIEVPRQSLLGLLDALKPVLTDLTSISLVTRAVEDDPPTDEPRPPRVFGLENAGARIIIRAITDSWVEIRDASGALLLTRVLRVGDAYRVPDRSGLSLVTGNAGGLEFIVDDEPVPALGPIGSVRRNVSLDPALLKSGQAYIQ